MSEQKFCTNCGSAVSPQAHFCVDCGSQTLKKSPLGQPASASSPSYPDGYAKRGYDTSRPLGVIILCVLLGLGIVLNLGGKILLFPDFSYYHVLGIVGLGLLVFQILVVYGLFTMKTWGGKVAIGGSALNIVYTFILYAVFADLIIDEALLQFGTDFEALYSNPIYSAILGETYDQVILNFTNSVRASLLFSFLITLILGSIIIGYVYAKREILFNP